MDKQQNPSKVNSGRGKTILIWVLILLLGFVMTLSFLEVKGKNEEIDRLIDLTFELEGTLMPDDFGLASMKDYNKWKHTTFKIPEYDDIPENFKRGIVRIFMDNGYYVSDGNPNYFLTRIADRADKVYAFGNFTGGNSKEMAFLLERFDFKSSELYIISELGDLLYWKELSDELPTIHQFKKGARIFMDEMKLVPAPVDGLISNDKDNKYVYLYNQSTKTFNKYYQYTNEDIKNEKEEREYYQDYED